MENKLDIIRLQTGTITNSVKQMKTMLEGCRSLAEDNITLARDMKEHEIAFTYTHVANDIETLQHMVNTLLKMLEDEAVSEYRAKLRNNGK